MSQLLPTKVTNPNRHPAHPHSLLHGAHYVAPSIHPMRSLEADCRKYIHKHHSNVDFGSVADDHTGNITIINMIELVLPRESSNPIAATPVP